MKVSAFTNSPSFGRYEKTFVMIKPDAFARNLDGMIMARLTCRGLKVKMSKEGLLNKPALEKYYQRRADKPYFKSWINYLTSGKVRIMEVEGDDAISNTLYIKKSVRNYFAPGEKSVNLLHCADDAVHAQKDTEAFFRMLA